MREWFRQRVLDKFQEVKCGACGTLLFKLYKLGRDRNSINFHLTLECGQPNAQQIGSELIAECRNCQAVNVIKLRVPSSYRGWHR